MARPGPKPVPDNVLDLHGENRQSRVGSSPPVPPAEPVEQPPTLEAGGRVVWGELAPMLERMGTLTAADAERFALLCNAIASYRLVARDVTERGALVKGRSDVLVLNPSMGAMERYSRIIVRLSEPFGMSPSDRAALARDGWVGAHGWRGGRKRPDDVPEDDGLDALLDG